MSQPLVTRPAYGHGGSSMPTASDSPHLGESGLPTGGPAKKGQPLDSDIPGTSTHAKPVQDVREFDKAEEGSIYRKDGPDDRAKKQDNPEGDRRDNRWIQPRYESPGGRPPGDPTVTDYPYRDKRPHEHYAATDPEMVVQLWRLRNAHELVLSPASTVKVAVRLSEIMRGVNKRTLWKSGLCRATIKRKDPKNLRWIFSVNCGNGPKLVNLKAERSSKQTRITSMDLRVRCSCPAWQWLGPEFHAKSQGYQDGVTRGTANTPNIKDPERHNRVCKHVAAVMQEIKEWVVPQTPKKK